MKLIKEIMSSRAVAVVSLVVVALLTFVGCGVKSPKLSYPQVATGQVVTYDADGAVMEGIKEGAPLYGQDAHYLMGAKMSYKNNGDGTVTDLNTGLMWQMVPANQGFDWQDANDYCENLELGGYSDWRVPSAKELYSISDFGTGWPYINTDYFDLVAGERVGKDEQYWTSHKYVGTIAQGGASSAFGVNHATGHIKAYAAGGGQRGGQRGEGQEGAFQAQGGQGQGQRPEGAPQREGQAQRQRPQGQAGQGERPERDSTQVAQGGRPQMAQGGQGQGQRPEGAPQGEGQAQRQRPQGAPQGDAPQGGAPQMGGQGGAPQMGNPMQKYVRAVRGNIYGVNDFVDNGDGTITDKATGLMWTQADSQEGMDWVAALQYAEGSQMAGYDDWRLPNVKELQGILCYDYAPNAVNPENVGAAIDPIFSCTQIVNENGDKDYPYFWTSTSALFQRGRPYYYAWYVAFGRAVNNGGIDTHGAGGVRFDTKYEGGPAGEGGERYYNYVRLVRNVK